jgi:putative NADPH-quinone reductase
MTLQMGASNGRLVKRYDDQLVATEALVLIYPAWWYGMPAMLKGYFRLRLAATGCQAWYLTSFHGQYSHLSKGATLIETAPHNFVSLL